VFLKNQRRWQCKSVHDHRQFSVKVGTIFEDSLLGLDKWFVAVWMITNDKNGVSSYEVHRALGVTQKTAWFMLHRIRLAMQTGSFLKKVGGSGTEVEIDETFIGGKGKNMHRSRKLRLNQIRSELRNSESAVPYLGKTAVMGMLDREQRKVRATVVPDVKRYVDEEVFRYNNRATKSNPLNDSDRFKMVLEQVAGKRLTYAELTGKEGERAAL
jgi:hypothetical protein